MGIAEQPGRRPWIGDANRSNRETPQRKPTESAGLLELVEAIADLRRRMDLAEALLAKVTINAVAGNTGNMSPDSLLDSLPRSRLTPAEKQRRYRLRKAGKLPE